MPLSCLITSWMRSEGSTGEEILQHVAHQAADGFADRGGIRAGLGGIDKDLEGLVLAVLVDGDEGFPEGGFHREGVAHQVARARLLGPLPEHGLLGGGCRGAGLGVDHGGVGFLGEGCLGLQHHFLARAGDIHGDALAAQLPGQGIGRGHILRGGGGGEVDRLG